MSPGEEQVNTRDMENEWTIFNLDELEGHLGRDVDAFDIMFPCLIVVALLGQGLGNCEVLVPFTEGDTLENWQDGHNYMEGYALPFPLDLCPFLCRKWSSVKDHVWGDLVVLEQPNTVHGVVNISNQHRVNVASAKINTATTAHE